MCGLEDKDDAKEIATQALQELGLQIDVAKIISLHPKKFAYSRLVNFLISLAHEGQKLITSILQKLNIDTDPTEKVKRLVERLDNRILLGDILSSYKKKMDMYPKRLLDVLDIVHKFEASDIIDVFDKEPIEWFNRAKFIHEQKQSGRPVLMIEEKKFIEKAKADELT